MMNEDRYLLVGSEDLSREFNDLADYYSDFHKEVYGFRPRTLALCACDYPDHKSLVEAMSHLERLVDGLQDVAEHVFAERRADEKKAVEEFESTVAHYIQCGAGNRANAIRWICESYDVMHEPGQNGWEHLEYQCQIPFGYISNSMKVAA